MIIVSIIHKMSLLAKRFLAKQKLFYDPKSLNDVMTSKKGPGLF